MLLVILIPTVMKTYLEVSKPVVIIMTIMMIITTVIAVQQFMRCLILLRFDMSIGPCRSHSG